MTSGPVVLQVLEGENAVLANREAMGATNPVDAAWMELFGRTLPSRSKPIRCMAQTA